MDVKKDRHRGIIRIKSVKGYAMASIEPGYTRTRVSVNNISTAGRETIPNRGHRAIQTDPD